MNIDDEIKKLAMAFAVRTLTEAAAKDIEKTLNENGIEAECLIRVKSIDVTLFKKRLDEYSKATHGAVKTVETQIGDTLFRVREDASDGEEKK